MFPTKLKVLIIEDDEDDFVLAKELLTDIDKHAFVISHASTFQEGLKALKAQRHDIYLIDYNLGPQTGVELIRQAKKSGQVLPVIMLTGEINPTIDVSAMKAGAFDYLIKGQVTSQILERSIRYTLERFNTLNALTQSERRYKGLFASIHESILIIDKDRRVLDCNPSFTQLFGYSIDELIGKKPFKIYKSREEYQRVGNLVKTNRNKQLNLHKIHFKRKNNTTFFADVTLYPLKDVQGKQYGYMGMARDITKQVEAEEREKQLFEEKLARAEAEAAKKKLKFLSDASGILTSSLDYYKTLANIGKLVVPQIADWCSVDILDEEGTMSNIIIAHSNPKKIKWGLLLREHYPPKPTDPFGMYNVVRTGKSELYADFSKMDVASMVNKLHLRLMQRVGIRSAMIVPLRGREKIFGTLSFVSSESKHIFSHDDLLLAEELAHRAGIAIDNARLYASAHEGIRVRDEFLNIASHELKTPLTSLQLQMQILLKTLPLYLPEASPLPSIISGGERQIKRLSQLINNLLDVSRISGHKLELEREKVELGALIKEVLERFNNEGSPALSTIKLKLQPNLFGYWDKSRLDQVITNLVSNALKYGENKRITITTRKKDNNAYLSIEDQGIGIADKELNRIFNRFERTREAKRYGGLGLGLYIVKQIVDAHQGHIEVKSTIGKGTKFSLIFPFNIQEKEETTRSDHSAQSEEGVLVS